MIKILAKILLVFLIVISVNSSSYAQSSKKVCIHMKSQTLQKGKILITEADQYFTFPEGKIITYFNRPDEYIFISNPLGEAKIYRPAQNNVILQSNELFTTKNNSLYFFLTNQTYDLGLKKLGLKVYDSEEDGLLLITRWQAPPHMIAQVDKIELVHENMLPIYSKYTNTKGETTLKVYFEDFVIIDNSQIPKRITEIVYLPEGDSLIKRTDYTDIKSGSGCDAEKFNFIIPENAKVTK